jgi:UDP-N-acetylmuramoylalanine--D-glutamate ligase
MNASREYFSFSSGFHVKNGCFLSGDEIIICQEGIESSLIEITDEFPLKGRHNRMNMMAATLAAKVAGAGDEPIRQGLMTFRGLEHRLENVGDFDGITYYNDSIATIPEATIAAVRALPATDTLILGGFDRSLDYSALIEFLGESSVRNFIFMGKAGNRMYEEFIAAGVRGKYLFRAASMQEVIGIARRVTRQGSICLLSPAAASYDTYKNFEERGHIYKKIARGF